MSRKLTQEEFEAKFYMKYPTEFKVIGLYKNATTCVDVECTKCKYIISQTPNHYDKGTTKCPVCNINGNTLKTIVGVNDMWTTNPNVAKWLSNPKDGYIYRFNTMKELDFICPDCKKHRIIRPNYLKNGFVCLYCSDNITYPNKLMANILDLCGIKFIPEYHICKYSYRYDFFIRLNGIKYLIEMDGGYGHGNIDTYSSTKEEQIETDKIKDNLAYENGYEIIRIDCNYARIDDRFNYISKNILKSKLNDIISISKSILNEADMVSQRNYLSRFSDCWNNGMRSYEDFFNVFHTKHRSTVRHYAKRAIETNLLDISYTDFLKQIRIASNEKLAKTKGTPVLCEQTQEVFYSIAEAERKMNISSLGRFFHGDYNYCGKLPDGTKLTWKMITKEEYKNIMK